MRKITLFSFGYSGWGNWTPKLVEAADAIERCRGFRPPMFVDIRIRRNVRAVGFNGTAFQELLGEERHRTREPLVMERMKPILDVLREQERNPGPRFLT